MSDSLMLHDYIRAQREQFIKNMVNRDKRPDNTEIARNVGNMIQRGATFTRVCLDKDYLEQVTVVDKTKDLDGTPLYILKGQSYYVVPRFVERLLGGIVNIDFVYCCSADDAEKVVRQRLEQRLENLSRRCGHKCTHGDH
ncbi:hypothetical protein S1R3X_000028 [Vibrio phage vB_ValS_VA-RY-4]|nr:hypothetical protein S1R3X_000028 [Vibrio phage vB_ValS_VA-RY-4]WGH28419.1 hypothetical protein 13VO501A_gene0036 [Vibrio phage 13VO501A]CAH0448177.1 hypothetical protein SM030_00044 [Vibrio phage vB_VpaS_sm030]CAI5930092.1 hypothetical protein SM031_00044 [Vibrio phage vB_VpaS_sm030]CAI6013106.1 hypothetical protein SM032_00044 [Vibrio phage vB_VpaS_sm030]